MSFGISTKSYNEGEIRRLDRLIKLSEQYVDSYDKNNPNAAYNPHRHDIETMRRRQYELVEEIRRDE